MIQVGAAEARAGEKAEIAAQWARYGPQVGQTGALSPVLHNTTDQGGIIVVRRRAEQRHHRPRIKGLRALMMSLHLPSPHDVEASVGA